MLTLIGFVPSRAPAQEAKPAEEWEEPQASPKPGGMRDEEARRRLLEMETWRRKLEAELRKREEEKADKARIDISGKYKVRFNLRDNLNLNNPLMAWRFDQEDYFDQRFQLQFDVTYGALSTVLLLDKGNFVFDWKEDSEGTLDRWAEFQTVNAALVRELFLQYTGPLTFKIGRQNWAPGHSIVLEGPVDSMRLTYSLGRTPLGNLSTTAGYLSLSGGWRSYLKFRQTGPPAGAREEVFGSANKLDGFYLGLDLRPVKGWRISPYGLKLNDRGRFGEADLNLDKDFDASTTPRDGAFEPLWLGLALSGGHGPLSVEAESISLSGSYAQSRKLRAHAFYLRGDYAMGEARFLGKTSMGLEGGLGSGDGTGSPSTSGTVRDFNALFMCRDRHKFGNVFSEDLRAGYFFYDSNLSNVTYLRGRAVFEPLREVRISPSFSRIWSTEDVYKGRGAVRDWSLGRSTSLDTTRDVGWEADFDMDFPILKRLAGFLRSGCFIPGEAYRRSDGRKADPAFELALGTEFTF